MASLAKTNVIFIAKSDPKQFHVNYYASILALSCKTNRGWVTRLLLALIIMTQQFKCRIKLRIKSLIKSSQKRRFPEDKLVNKGDTANILKPLSFNREWMLMKSLSVQTNYFIVQVWYQSWRLCSVDFNSFAIPCREITQNSEWSCFFLHDRPTCLFVCEHYSNCIWNWNFGRLSKIGHTHNTGVIKINLSTMLPGTVAVCDLSCNCSCPNCNETTLCPFTTIILAHRTARMSEIVIIIIFYELPTTEHILPIIMVCT